MAQIYGIQDLKKDFSQFADTDDVTKALFLFEAYKAWSDKRDETITDWNQQLVSFSNEHYYVCVTNGRLLRVEPRKVNKVTMGSQVYYDEIKCSPLHFQSKEDLSSLEKRVLDHFAVTITKNFDELFEATKRRVNGVIYGCVGEVLPGYVADIGEKALTFYLGSKEAKRLLSEADKLTKEGRGGHGIRMCPD